MVYKTLKKVSNVCQLLDKSKYPATTTKEGITWTNNGDGTITANGTATSGSGFRLDTFYIDGNRTYLMIGCPKGGGSGKYFMFDGYSKLGSDLGSGVIKTVSGSDRTLCSPILYVVTGQTVSNLVFKPQLFDLTEMYGAGNEPTTVEQFRQDFPNEIYDYSPYCWLTSYKRVFMTGEGNYITSYQSNLTCKTKNLLPYPYYETTITRNGVTFTDNRDGTITANGTSTNFATFVFSKNYNFIAGNTYYVSTPYSIIAYKENGTIHYITGNKSFTWSSNWEVVQIYVQINKGITLNNLKIYPMINLGDTATDYVPYGHL